MIVVGFVAWKYLGGSVSKSTDKAEGKFKKGESGQTAAAGAGGAGAQQSSGDQSGDKSGSAGKQNTASGGGGGGGGTQAKGAGGGAQVATVQKPGTGGAADNRGSGRAVAAGEEGTHQKPKNWLKYFMIALLVIGLMAAVYSFGKKKSTA
jgi:hypothetical protein